jgi:hypothetical protein
MSFMNIENSNDLALFGNTAYVNDKKYFNNINLIKKYYIHYIMLIC